MKKILTMLLMLLFAVACSNGVKEDLELDKLKMDAPMGRGDMMAQMQEALNNSKNLTQKQKDDFINLHHDVFVESQKLRDEIRKLKVLLFKALAEEDMDSARVKEITSQVRKKYNQRLDIMLDAFGKSKKILGKDMINFYKDVGYETNHQF